MSREATKKDRWAVEFAVARTDLDGRKPTDEQLIGEMRVGGTSPRRSGDTAVVTE